MGGRPTSEVTTASPTKNTKLKRESLSQVGMPYPSRMIRPEQRAGWPGGFLAIAEGAAPKAISRGVDSGDRASNVQTLCHATGAMR